MLEQAGLEVPAELSVEDVEEVQVGGRRHPDGVVVGRLQPARVLDEIRAEQQVVARDERRRQLGEERRARAGCDVADRRAEERDQAPAASGHEADVPLEVGGEPVHLDPRVALGHESARARTAPSATSGGTNRRSVPRPASASRSSRVFSPLPEPSSTSVSVPVSRATATASG